MIDLSPRLILSNQVPLIWKMLTDIGSEKGKAEGEVAQLFWCSWRMVQNFIRFAKKKKPKNISKKQKYHSTDDDCYLKKIC